ncbi:hypothetical protein R3P38DRAFT_3368293 [Favolaschia claudopus]|uniref:Uncharacterized protein n=1 Tax=Favolaschia claudopus TaxID=2862362 RepID=A0AAW0A6V3_9AGAR
MFVLRCAAPTVSAHSGKKPNIPRSVTYGYMAPFGRWEHGTGKYDTSAHFQKSDSCGLGASAITLASGEVLGVIGAQMKVIRISDATTPPTLQTSKAHFPQLPPFQGPLPRPIDPLRQVLMHQLCMKPLIHPTVDPDGFAEDLVRRIALQARWTGIKALSSALVLPFLFKSTAALNFLYTTSPYSINFVSICSVLYKLQVVTASTPNLPSNHIPTTLYHSLYSFYSCMRCTF